jgi:predicted GH43/DUF377 family glycosyl hydrolase
VKRFYRASAIAIALWGLGLQTAISQVVQKNLERPKKLLQLVKKLEPADHRSAPREQELRSYLFVYFKDETHSIYFATSTDGYTFTDVNDGKPVLLGIDVAEQRGVRDPHIARGPDHAFYMVMTDLHVFGREAGVRTTQWERPGEEYGWGNNKNLLLMKSYDLLHWTLARVPVAERFEAAKNVGAVWAPQTIYDPTRRKLMVYYTTRDKNGPNHLVYSYANHDFTILETAPQSLFNYPVAGKSAIDGDITKVGDEYHLFYVAHDQPGYLKQAISSKINAGYRFDPQKVDPETVANEAPNLWRRHGTNTYVLMYDVFGAKPRNNMGFSETTDFVHFKNIGRLNDPDSRMKGTNFANPKHGAVIAITPEEAERLQDYFAAQR